MPKQDVIVIGTSAGGVETLTDLARQLPGDLQAAVFVVMHVYPRSKSLLASILNDAGPLPASNAEDGAPIEMGRIYVAPPDHHLVVEHGHMHLSMGPKEQHQRPCINVTLRSAALAYGERVAGVVLSGQLDDGTAGLWDLKRRGGIAIVQNPEEALFPSMPLSALREIEADYTLRLADIAKTLHRLATGNVEEKVEMSTRTDVGMEANLTEVTCPDCRGTIWEVPRGGLTEYRCRVGHTFSPTTMLAEHFTAQEKVMWAAVVALEEGATLAKLMSEKLRPELRPQLLEESHERLEEAATLRRLLTRRRTFTLD